MSVRVSHFSLLNGNETIYPGIHESFPNLVPLKLMRPNALMIPSQSLHSERLLVLGEEFRCYDRTSHEVPHACAIDYGHESEAEGHYFPRLHCYVSASLLTSYTAIGN
jgi:hypothetical protein